MGDAVSMQSLRSRADTHLNRIRNLNGILARGDEAAYALTYAAWAKAVNAEGSGPYVMIPKGRYRR